MKNLLLFALALLSATDAIGQRQPGVFRIGFKAGYGLSTFHYTGTDATGISKKSLPGYQAGLYFEYELSKQLGFHTGFEVQSKGDQAAVQFAGLTYSSKLKPVYLQIPVLFGYSTNHLYAGAGPVFGKGFTGTNWSQITGFPAKEKGIYWGASPESDLKPFEFGLRGEVCYKFKPLRLGLNFDLGLSDINPARRWQDLHIYNRCANIWIGYVFK
jgi:hypothetical protein